MQHIFSVAHFVKNLPACCRVQHENLIKKQRHCNKATFLIQNYSKVILLASIKVLSLVIASCTCLNICNFFPSYGLLSPQLISNCWPFVTLGDHWSSYFILQQTIHRSVSQNKFDDRSQHLMRDPFFVVSIILWHEFYHLLAGFMIICNHFMST